jgi:two-component system chemotaxis sensor kinase CheA
MESIKATFFEECDELLAELEAGLLALEAGEGDAETINAVFRAVHSIKGGAGAFGLEDLVSFAHVFETALDAMRSGALLAEAETLKIMLRAADLLADHVQSAKGGGELNMARAQSSAAELGALTCRASSEPVVGIPATEADEWGFTPIRFEADALSPPWRLTMTPRARMYANGHDAHLLLRELVLLGAVDVELDTSALPPLADLNPEEAYLAWSMTLPALVGRDEIESVFEFAGEDCPFTLERLEVAPGSGISQAGQEAADVQPVAQGADQTATIQVSAKPAGATIRVDLERVDRLINLVGELVINQAMLAQRVGESGVASSSSVAIGLGELEQLTREIQDSVMAIRAQPVKSVFQRMPRLVREIADSTGKRVRLVTEGEGTEVDKTVIERLSDPITHMLRNAIDHGVETPEQRVEAGKTEEGVIRLAALHRSGRIVIEVADDGRGIDRQRVREIAVHKGLVAADVSLSEEEVDNLIFLPGFSTASSVSSISGRGVGMDVVKRSVQSLGGRIAIASQPGRGSTFTLSLPLTLAVLDGMVVSVDEHTLVTPLSGIVETLKAKPSDVRRIGPADCLLSVRGSHVPLVDIGVALGWRQHPIDPIAGVTLLVESEGGARAALVVDSIQGQRQVVIKSLEANYQRIDAVAAATILGDGRVALILDIDALIETRGAGRPLAQAS